MLSLVRVFGGRRRRVVWYGAAALTTLLAPVAVCGADADAALREAAADFLGHLADFARAAAHFLAWARERWAP